MPSGFAQDSAATAALLLVSCCWVQALSTLYDPAIGLQRLEKTFYGPSGEEKSSFASQGSFRRCPEALHRVLPDA